jgi:hypothetical protein
LWELDWRPTEGNYRLIARAKDADGNTQPMEQQWNPSGYLWNVAAPKDVAVSRTEQMPAASTASAPAAELPTGYKAACLTCHQEDIIRMQRLTPAQWDREVNKMVGWGAEIKPDEKESILNYLKTNFKP